MSAVGIRGEDALRPALRVVMVSDLPDETLLHMITGHHWPEVPAVPITVGWGGAPVSRLDFRCSCGRRRKEVVHDETGEVLSRMYGEGTLLASGRYLSRAEARVEWIARQGLRSRRKSG